MEKKSIFAILCIATACWGTFAAYSLDGHVDETNDATFAANIEALAQGEGPGMSHEWACWSETDAGSGVWVCGDPCSYNPFGRGSRGESKCYSNK